MVVLTMVTDATKLKALPIKFVWIVVPAVENVMPELEMMVPAMALPVAIVAALPTTQKTFFACALLINRILGANVGDPTVKLLAIWKTHVALLLPWPSSVKSPAVIENFPPAAV